MIFELSQLNKIFHLQNPYRKQIKKKKMIIKSKKTNPKKTNPKKSNTKKNKKDKRNLKI